MQGYTQLARSEARPDGGLPASALDRVTADLAAAAVAREAQLRALRPATTPVAVAHRESIQRILALIHAAQAQVADGTYGSCRRCGQRADVQLTLARPWVPLCSTCGRP